MDENSLYASANETANVTSYGQSDSDLTIEKLILKNKELDKRNQLLEK